MTSSIRTVGLLESCSDQDARDIYSLLIELSERFAKKGFDSRILDEIIQSPYHDCVIARSSSGRIVGMATLSITFGPGAGRKAYLEDFVVAPSERGTGLSDEIWNEIIIWCESRQATLFFTSNSKRVAAHRFYLKHGATIRDTTVFKYSPLTRKK